MASTHDAHDDAQAGAPAHPAAALERAPRIGEEVRFAYPSADGEVVLVPAKVVFLWPGDVLDLDVRVPRSGKVRRERVRPHLGSRLLADTWRP